MSEYTTDIEFVKQFNAKQTPARLNYTAALNGMPPRPLDQAFTYCDLGCGPGMTVNALAAAHPTGEFWGIDLNANHVRMGQRVAQETGVEANTTFLQANIADLAEHDLPQFDFIAINGLFSWLSDERRSEAMDFLVRCLKPGGYAYIQYIAYPGYALKEPIYRLLQDKFNEFTDFDATPEDKVLLTQSFLKQFKETQKTFIEQSPSAAIIIDRIVQTPAESFLHDYVNPHRHAFYFNDIEAEMNRRELRFAGTADFWMNHLALCMPPEGRTLIQSATNRSSLERLKDFACLTAGRRDVYCKVNPEQAEVDGDPLLDVVLGATSCEGQDQRSGFPGGTIHTDGEPYLTIHNLLYDRPRSLRSVFEAPELAELSRSEIKRSVTYLAAAGRIEPFAATVPETVTGSGPAGLSRFNTVVLEEAVLRSRPGKTPVVNLASPVVGRNVGLSWQDAAILYALATQPADEASGWLAARFQRLGVVLHERGAEDTATEETTRQYIEINLPGLHDRLHDMTRRFALAALPEVAEEMATPL